MTTQTEVPPKAEIKLPAKLEDMREAARIVSDILLELAEMTVPGADLGMLDEIAERRIREAGGEPAFKDYKPAWAVEPFPATLCCSIDFEVCHAAPKRRVLQEGQIIKYDLGMKYKSGYGDAAITVPVGEISSRKQRLMRYSLEAIYKGIEQVKAGQMISAIGNAIDTYAGLNGFTVIKEFCGHHIGSELHMKPDVPNFLVKENDSALQEGSIICIEPMITPGKGAINIWHEDKWTAYCVDSQPVAQFEHMVLVTKEGYEILTTWDK